MKELKKKPHHPKAISKIPGVGYMQTKNCHETRSNETDIHFTDHATGLQKEPEVTGKELLLLEA